MVQNPIHRTMPLKSAPRLDPFQCPAPTEGILRAFLNPAPKAAFVCGTHLGSTQLGANAHWRHLQPPIAVFKPRMWQIQCAQHGQSIALFFASP